jgi:hypothetical protein
VAFLQEIHGAGVDLCLFQQAIDTTTPAGNAARAALMNRSPHAVRCHSIDYCEQGIDGTAQHGAERRVAFNAVRLPIGRIVVQYGEVARAALCAFDHDGSSLARDRLVAL